MRRLRRADSWHGSVGGKFSRKRRAFPEAGPQPSARPTTTAPSWMIVRIRDLAVTAGLNPVFSEKFLRFVIDEVIRHHKQDGYDQA